MSWFEILIIKSFILYLKTSKKTRILFYLEEKKIILLETRKNVFFRKRKFSWTDQQAEIFLAGTHLKIHWIQFSKNFKYLKIKFFFISENAFLFGWKSRITMFKKWITLIMRGAEVINKSHSTKTASKRKNDRRLKHIDKLHLI
jgi:hypothetical protein